MHIQYGKIFGGGDTIGVILDKDVGYVAFFLNGEFLGNAFKNKELKEGIHVPFVSCLVRGESFETAR